MANNDIRRCPGCNAVWVEDDQMYEDADTCPHCGLILGDETTDPGPDDEVYTS